MNYCDQCETCAHCLKHGCIPPGKQSPAEIRQIDFNVNSYVSVKLTDSGRAHHRADFEQWTSHLQNKPAYEPPKEDADGWSRWQLWHFMELFGPIVHLGSWLPFEAVIRFDSKS